MVAVNVEDDDGGGGEGGQGYGIGVGIGGRVVKGDEVAFLTPASSVGAAFISTPPPAGDGNGRERKGERERRLEVERDLTCGSHSPCWPKLCPILLGKFSTPVLITEGLAVLLRVEDEIQTLPLEELKMNLFPLLVTPANSAARLIPDEPTYKTSAWVVQAGVVEHMIYTYRGPFSADVRFLNVFAAVASHCLTHTSVRTGALTKK